MKYDELLKISENTLEMLDKGAFLVTKDGEKRNAMIISWGAIGQLWGKPMMVIMIRQKHYTHELLEKNKEFTVTFAEPEVIKEAWKVSGTKSGKEIDKFCEFCKMELNLIPGKEVNVPILDTPSKHFECRVLFETDVNPEGMSEESFRELYPKGNLHTIYFAEIVSAYETK